MSLGVIGYGTIATLALEAVARGLARPLDRVICLAKPEGVGRAQAMLERAGPRLARECHVVTSLGDLLAARPCLVVEAAGHGAVRACGPQILAARLDFLVTSVGALADESLHRALNEASAEGGALICSTGAIGGIDLLRAAKLSGLKDVAYTSRKPPLAWRGTLAEKLVDLAALKTETVFYEGSARGAARDFPQNANVAATLALAGAGFEATRVRLIADPAVSANVHEIGFTSACVDVALRIEGRAAPENPKTSLTTAYSVAAQILDHLSPPANRR